MWSIIRQKVVLLSLIHISRRICDRHSKGQNDKFANRILNKRCITRRLNEFLPLGYFSFKVMYSGQNVSFKKYIPNDDIPHAWMCDSHCVYNVCIAYGVNNYVWIDYVGTYVLPGCTALWNFKTSDRPPPPISFNERNGILTPLVIDDEFLESEKLPWSLSFKGGRGGGEQNLLKTGDDRAWKIMEQRRLFLFKIVDNANLRLL